MKKGMLKKAFAVALVGVMGLSLVACGGKEDEPKDQLDVIKENKKIVVGLSADYAPYEFIVMENGEKKVVGFDIDLAKEIAKDMGVELEIQEMEFESIVAAIPSDKIDLGISGLNPDEDRKKAVDFSDIYYEANHVTIVKKSDVDKYAKPEDFNGKKVGAQLGSTQEKLAKANLKEAALTTLSNVNQLVMELKAGKVDGLVVEGPVAKMIVKANPELAIGKVEFKEEEGGSAVAFKKGSPKLQEQINKTIKRLKESGELDKFIDAANELASKQAE